MQIKGCEWRDTKQLSIIDSKKASWIIQAKPFINSMSKTWKQCDQHVCLIHKDNNFITKVFDNQHKGRCKN